MADQGWTLTIEGHVFREYDLTLDDIEALEGATGLTWRTLHPLKSGTVAKQIAVCLLVRRAAFDEVVATKTVGEMRGKDFLDCIGTYDPDADLPSEYRDGIPPQADGTSTPT